MDPLPVSPIFLQFFFCVCLLSGLGVSLFSVQETKYGDYLYVRFIFFLGPVLKFFYAFLFCVCRRVQLFIYMQAQELFKTRILHLNGRN
jgi:hypothetical protein